MTEEILVDPFGDDEVHALKALYAGTATEYQQRLALSFVVHKLARTHDIGYIPQDTHASAFLQGRGFVGRQILKFIEAPFDKLGLETPNDR